MQLQFAPNCWSCLPTAFAMVLDVPVDEVIAALGHDGSEKLWPELSDPHARRAFSLQELVDYSVSQQRFPVQIDIDCAYGPEHDVEMLCDPFPDTLTRIQKYLLLPCVLVGIGPNKGRHAVAWCPTSRKVYDSDGFVSTLDRYELEHLIVMF